MAYLDTDGVRYLWAKLKAAFAQKADFDSHVADDVRHVTSSERDTWNGKGTVSSVSTGVGLTGGDVTTTGTIKAKLKSEASHTQASASPTNVSGRQYPVGVDSDGNLSANVPWTDTTDLTSMSGTLGVAHGGTGVATLGAGVVYHSASGTGALSVATASDLVSAIGATPVARATADASGNDISDTYARKSDIGGVYKYRGSVAAVANLPSSGQSTGDVYNIESASAYGAAGANVAWNGTAWDTLGEVFSVDSITNADIDSICV